MLVSIQLICIAISLIFAAALSIGSYFNAAWLNFRDGIIRDLMFEFVIFTFLLTVLVTVVRPQ